MANVKDSTKMDNDQVVASLAFSGLLGVVIGAFFPNSEFDLFVTSKKESIVLLIIFRVLFVFVVTGAIIILLQHYISVFWLPITALSIAGVTSLFKIVGLVLRFPQ